MDDKAENSSLLASRLTYSFQPAMDDLRRLRMEVAKPVGYINELKGRRRSVKAVS